jgi:hypothetical protein
LKLTPRATPSPSDSDKRGAPDRNGRREARDGARTQGPPTSGNQQGEGSPARRRRRRRRPAGEGGAPKPA